MPHTIFFSWQADTATKTGRNLVERALRQAIGALGKDANLEEAVRDLAVDKDTDGVPGSPPIVETIFRKIDAAAIFVPDLTFVGSRLDGRPTPNPNVLIEYGWALKALGHARIVPIMNSAYGRPTLEAMPFDMRHLRNPIQYDCPDDADDDARGRVKAELTRMLERGLRDVLRSEAFQAILPRPPVVAAFQERVFLAGPGRFNADGAPIGISNHSHEEIQLNSGATTWLRVMPATETGRRWTTSELREAATGKSTLLMPLGASVGGFGYLRAEDGFGVWASDGVGGTSTSLVAMFFHSGEIWAVDTYRVDATRRDGRGFIPLDEQNFAKSLADYTIVLERLGVPPPYRWISGMEGLKGRPLLVPARVPGGIASFGEGASVSDVVVVKGTHMPNTRAAVSLRPFFEKIYESCDVVRPTWLDN